MSLGRFLLVTSTTAFVGYAAYSVYKAGGVRPAIANVVKSSVKAGNWASKKYSCAKNEVTRMVDEAKTEIASGGEV
ncbi:hypothetical protein [Desulfovibrio sp. UCD-KL4C]|uniref:hypothetical protein n=1 Tax=Desulfovibrio sp. UCD-KL4C TaxID=2578120 RepID=UPI0025C12D76|nr:hypothetical protein [Desulfovibrio sp. UCD-KL4C]